MASLYPAVPRLGLVILATVALIGAGCETLQRWQDETAATVGEAVHHYCAASTPISQRAWRSEVNAAAAGDCVLIWCRSGGSPAPSFQTDCPTPQPPAEQ